MSQDISDSDLRRALIGTWRLVRHPLGDKPQGYLVYTSDGHVFVQFVIRAERNWPGPEILELTNDRDRLAVFGFSAYCGTFEIREGQAIHRREFGVFPSMTGNIETRSVELKGDRLILGLPGGVSIEWRRFH
jgi:hypothetical protein